jgi:ABC-type multidrug transport system ATPase subunit
VTAIETEGLTKFYGDARGIEDVTLTVEPGEVFGFLGPNGAGKTTTIRTLLDLLHPSRGSARIFGLDSRRDSVAIRRRLGNLPGDFGYGKRSSGREALKLLACGRSRTSAAPRSWRAASAPSSTGRWASSRAAIGRRSASSSPSSTGPSC